MFETKPMRAFSWNPTPEKCSNPKSGIVNIKNDDDGLCFQWCLRYHQTPRGDHDSMLSKLKQVEENKYEGMAFQASDQAGSAFVEVNKVCIFIYELDSEGNIRLGQKGNVEYQTTDLTYLLRLEADNKSHYIYIKIIDHFFKLQKHTHDKDKRFSPVWSKKSWINELRSHISKCYMFDSNSTLIKIPSDENAHMNFKYSQNKLKRTCAIDADNECAFVPTSLKHKTHKHVPNSACFYLVCDHDPTQNRLEQYIREIA